MPHEPESSLRALPVVRRVSLLHGRVKLPGIARTEGSAQDTDQGAHGAEEERPQDDVSHGATEIPEDGGLKTCFDLFDRRDRGRGADPAGNLLVVGDDAWGRLAGIVAYLVGKERSVEG